jgi:hypothetical protein
MVVRQLREAAFNDREAGLIAGVVKQRETGSELLNG